MYAPDEDEAAPGDDSSSDNPALIGELAKDKAQSLKTWLTVGGVALAALLVLSTVGAHKHRR